MSSEFMVRDGCDIRISYSSHMTYHYLHNVELDHKTLEANNDAIRSLNPHAEPHHGIHEENEEEERIDEGEAETPILAQGKRRQRPKDGRRPRRIVIQKKDDDTGEADGGDHAVRDFDLWNAMEWDLNMQSGDQEILIEAQLTHSGFPC